MTLPLLALSSVADVVIEEPYFHLSVPQRDWCLSNGLDELADRLPVWVPQRLISLALYGEEGVEVVMQALAARGRSTGAHRLAQLKPYDEYWGTGADGRGRNELGVILEELRAGILPTCS